LLDCINQHSLTLTLIDGYTFIAAILNIEFQTSRLAEAFPEDTIEQILRRKEELKAIGDKPIGFTGKRSV